MSTVQHENGPSDIIATEIAEVSWEDSKKDIIVMTFLRTDHHTLEDAKAVVDAHHRLCEGKKTGVLADITRTATGADGEARRYYVSEEASVMKKGMAMLVKSPLQRMLGNIFFRMNSPPYPSKLFTNRGKALRWLRSL